MWWQEFIGSSVFRYGIFPLISAVAGIFLKCVTRNDKYAFFKKEDMAVGPQLMLTAALTYLVVSTDRARALIEKNALIAQELSQNVTDQRLLSKLHFEATELLQQVSGAGWTLFAIMVGLWAITTLVKRLGWKTESDMHVLFGIAAPLAIGVFSLVFTMVVIAA